MFSIVRTGVFFAAVSVLSILTLSPASAGFIQNRYGYQVTPAMMHAIDVIVSEHSKMMRHKKHM